MPSVKNNAMNKKMPLVNIGIFIVLIIKLISLKLKKNTGWI